VFTRRKSFRACEHRLTSQRCALSPSPGNHLTIEIFNPFLQHLSYFGVRLNLRETERKRRKKVDDPSQSASAANAGAGSGVIKGKRRDDDGSGYED
jgi:hypothetical protein